MAADRHSWKVQRYPTDYDGVLSCAPTLSRTRSAAVWAWVAQAFAAEPEGELLERTLPAVQEALTAACDGVDGLKDGVISDPNRCHFDPSTLLCNGPNSGRCLTQPQVTAFRKFYAGPSNSKGEQIAPGFPPGAETDPGGSILCKTCMASAAHRASIFFEGLLDGRFHVETFNFDRDVRLLEESEAARLGNATQPDLTSFARRGGKLIIVHGWSDGTTPAMSTVNYYNSVVSRMGLRAVEGFVRLYMVPGMQHGGGGPGPNIFKDTALAALQHWVEEGVAPSAVIATKYHINGNPASGVARKRPLCPYPQISVYSGTGSVDDAANFSCRIQ